MPRGQGLLRTRLNRVFDQVQPAVCASAFRLACSSLDSEMEAEERGHTHSNTLSVRHHDGMYLHKAIGTFVYPRSKRPRAPEVAGHCHRVCQSWWEKAQIRSIAAPRDASLSQVAVTGTLGPRPSYNVHLALS